MDTLVENLRIKQIIMQTLCAFRPAHGDVVHDLQYDFYAKRLATASADQYIKVWEMMSTGDDTAATDGESVDATASSQWVLVEGWKVILIVLEIYVIDAPHQIPSNTGP